MKNHTIFATWYSRKELNDELIREWIKIRDEFIKDFLELYPEKTEKGFPKLHDPSHCDLLVYLFGAPINWYGLIAEQVHKEQKAEAKRYNFHGNINKNMLNRVNCILEYNIYKFFIFF